jgi:hypothetical protein
MFGICPNIRLKRLLEKNYKGHNRILKELDMVRIVNELKFLKDITKSIDPEAHKNFPFLENREIDVDSDSEEDLPPIKHLAR